MVRTAEQEQEFEKVRVAGHLREVQQILVTQKTILNDAINVEAFDGAHLMGEVLNLLLRAAIACCSAMHLEVRKAEREDYDELPF